MMGTDDIQVLHATDGYWWYTGSETVWGFLVGRSFGFTMPKRKRNYPIEKNVVRCPMVSWVSLLWIESSIDLSFFTPPINRPIFNGSPWGNQMYQRMGILITGLYPAIIEWGCNWRYMGCLLKWMICDMWDQNGRHDFLQLTIGK